MRGRDFATPDDVKSVAPATLRHRVSLRAEAELDGATPDAVVRDILNTLEVPR
jgi:MoxR-like ATPase